MIVYASRTGNVEHIVGKLSKDIPTIKLETTLIVEEPYFLFTYTDGLGDIPNVVKSFLIFNELNRRNLKGVIASGNTNFGIENYCGSADKISERFNVPIIRKIDLRGNSDDVETIEKYYKNMIAGETH